MEFPGTVRFAMLLWFMFDGVVGSSGDEIFVEVSGYAVAGNTLDFK